MQTDYVQRFMFENLDIRGRLVCLTGAWQRMLDGRGYPGDIVSLLGHTTAPIASAIRATINPSYADAARMNASYANTAGAESAR